jgi:hypothetical protein
MTKWIHIFKVASGKGKRTVSHMYTDERRAMMALDLCGGRLEVVEVKEVIRKGESRVL